CSAGLFFDDGVTTGAFFAPPANPDLCLGTAGGSGAIPQPNNLLQNPFGPGATVARNLSAGADFALDDELSAGSTNVEMPTIPDASMRPHDGEAVLTPFTVIALPRYVDPIAEALALNDPRSEPQVGNAPIVPSTASGSPVTFQYAPLGSSAFVTLGN